LLGYANLNTSQRKEGLLRLFDANNVHKNTFGDFDTVASIGLDYSGRYELLFTRLQDRLKNIPANDVLFQLDDAREQKLFLNKNTDYVVALKDVFTEVMHLDNLVRLFGKEATQNSIKPFSLHFFERTITAIETLPAKSNPYLAQLLQGKFYSKEYEWLSLPKQSLETEIRFMNSSMLEALCNGKEKYDFIHLSNILDWLDHHQATQLLYAASQKLAHGGQLVIRQLNSSLQIPNLCPDLFWQTEIASDLHKNDRSFFYQKIHVTTSYASN
jgi:S-adenosylmethionine-diacylglycerol 3-amino-3-carboxypropyl transferase